jgi:hypothetical protein
MRKRFHCVVRRRHLDEVLKDFFFAHLVLTVGPPDAVAVAAGQSAADPSQERRRGLQETRPVFWTLDEKRPTHAVRPAVRQAAELPPNLTNRESNFEDRRTPAILFNRHFAEVAPNGFTF